MIAFTHVVNPVIVPETSDLFVAQPIVFASMLRAREVARPDIDVTCVAACYPEDRALAPAQFIERTLPARSLRDLLPWIGVRKLPFLHDILVQAADATEADYLVYTNADIILHKTFYQRVAALLATGLESLTITRRTVEASYSASDALAAIEAEPGSPHPGFDCFVLPWAAVHTLDLGRLCIGLQGWEGPLIGNLLLHARPFAIFRDEHVTFHLGREQAWKHGHPRAHRINDANCREGCRVLRRLRRRTRERALRAYLREERRWLWKPPLVRRPHWRRIRTRLGLVALDRPFGGDPPRHAIATYGPRGSDGRVDPGAER
jgi:hypothetical protein